MPYMNPVVGFTLYGISIEFDKLLGTLHEGLHGSMVPAMIIMATGSQHQLSFPLVTHLQGGVKYNP